MTRRGPARCIPIEQVVKGVSSSRAHSINVSLQEANALYSERALTIEWKRDDRAKK